MGALGGMPSNVLIFSVPASIFLFFFVITFEALTAYKAFSYNHLRILSYKIIYVATSIRQNVLIVL